jgi:hypothetical protein
VTRRSWVAATALCLAVVTAATGSVPQDAIAGILATARVSGASRAQESGPVTFRATVDAARLLQEDVSARVPMWMTLLLVIILLLVWLIYHTWAGWKPLIRGG